MFVEITVKVGLGLDVIQKDNNPLTYKNWRVEGVFGVLKEDYGFRRFLTREKQSVKVEFMLLCFGYKLNKLHKSIQTQSLGVTLYKNSIA